MNIPDRNLNDQIHQDPWSVHDTEGTVNVPRLCLCQKFQLVISVEDEMPVVTHNTIFLVEIWSYWSR